MAGCSGNSSQAPKLSIGQATPEINLPEAPPQQFRELWSEANPMPDWLAKSNTDTKPPKVGQEIRSVQEDPLGRILQKLELIEKRLDALEKAQSK